MSLQTLPSGTAAAILTVALPLAGQPDEAVFRVEDASGALLLAEAPVPGSAFLDGRLDIPLAAAELTLAAGLTRDLRRVVVRYRAVDELGEAWQQAEAALVLTAAGQGELVVGENSVQTYGQALLLAADMLGLERFQAASPEARVAALAEAWRAIVRLRFDVRDAGTDRMTRVVDYPGQYPGDLRYYSAQELLGLAPKVLEALRRAQIAEADYRLGAGTDPREQGLMSSTVGEVSQMYRPGKPLQMAICRRAAAELAGTVVLRPRLTRA